MKITFEFGHFCNISNEMLKLKCKYVKTCKFEKNQKLVFCACSFSALKTIPRDVIIVFGLCGDDIHTIFSIEKQNFYSSQCFF